MEAQVLIANVTGKARRVMRDGKEYLVAPLSLIVPGVLRGSKGALLYPSDEVAANAGLWNGVPLTVNHPADPLTNEHISASEPGVYERQGIGVVQNDHWDGKKRRAEGWFDVEKTRKVDNRIYNALIKGQPIELSTGLFTDNETQQGNHNGTQYDAIARNYRSDHVAILPDQKGACSMSDGCGVLVNEFIENAEDGWVTLPSGTHVKLKGGKIVKGPKVGKSDDKPEGKSHKEDAHFYAGAAQRHANEYAKAVNAGNKTLADFHAGRATAHKATSDKSAEKAGIAKIPVRAAMSSEGGGLKGLFKRFIGKLTGNEATEAEESFAIMVNEFASDAQRQAFFGLKAAGDKENSTKAATHKEAGEFHRSEQKKAEKGGNYLKAMKHEIAADEHEAAHKKLTGNIGSQPRHVDSKQWQPYGDVHRAAELGGLHLTASDKLWGAKAAEELRDSGHNPASWVEDEDKWEKAKGAADKGDYEKSSSSYYAVVTHIYKNMGGAIKPSTNTASDRDKDGKFTGKGKKKAEEPAEAPEADPLAFGATGGGESAPLSSGAVDNAGNQIQRAPNGQFGQGGQQAQDQPTQGTDFSGQTGYEQAKAQGASAQDVAISDEAQKKGMSEDELKEQKGMGKDKKKPAANKALIAELTYNFWSDEARAASAEARKAGSAAKGNDKKADSASASAFTASKAAKDNPDAHLNAAAEHGKAILAHKSAMSAAIKKGDYDTAVKHDSAIDAHMKASNAHLDATRAGRLEARSAKPATNANATAGRNIDKDANAQGQGTPNDAGNDGRGKAVVTSQTDKKIPRQKQEQTGRTIEDDVPTGENIESMGTQSDDHQNPASSPSELKKWAKAHGIELSVNEKGEITGNCGSMASNDYGGDPHYASKEASVASLRSEHDGAFGHAKQAMDKSGDADSEGAAASHINAAKAHEKAATQARKDKEDPYDHDRAAALHRQAASQHTANPVQPPTANTTQGVPMNRQKVIAKLTANCTCDKRKATINALDDDTLKLLITNAAPMGGDMDDDDEEDEDVNNKDKSKAEGSNASASGSGFDQAGGAGTKGEYALSGNARKLSPMEQAALHYGMEGMQREKNTLIQRLTANAANDNARKQAVAIYSQMPLPQLRVLASGVPQQTNNMFVPAIAQDPAVNYFGAQGVGMGSITDNADEDDKALILESPTLNMQEISDSHSSDRKKNRTA